jgi:hypothetical protein
MLLYSSEPEALRAMLRDVFGFQWVDAGGGWLIFALPPSELGVHPAEGPNYEAGARHLVSFMCDEVQLEGEPQDEGYGITIMMKLPAAPT